MRIRFTNHANEKLILMRRFGFLIKRKDIIATLTSPIKIEDRIDGTLIATSLYDKQHVLRVVYRNDGAIIIVITFYPGRRKAYEV